MPSQVSEHRVTRTDGSHFIKNDNTRTAVMRSLRRILPDHFRPRQHAHLELLFQGTYTSIVGFVVSANLLQNTQTLHQRLVQLDLAPAPLVNVQKRDAGVNEVAANFGASGSRPRLAHQRVPGETANGANGLVGEAARTAGQSSDLFKNESQVSKVAHRLWSSGREDFRQSGHRAVDEDLLRRDRGHGQSVDNLETRDWQNMKIQSGTKQQRSKRFSTLSCSFAQ